MNNVVYAWKGCFSCDKMLIQDKENDFRPPPTTDYTVAIGKPERHVRKASHCGSKQQ